MKAGQGTMACRACGEHSAHGYCCGKTSKDSGKLLLDFRRVVARDLLRSGMPQSAALGVTGHQTNSMFSRYHITDTSNIRTALKSMTACRSEREQKLVAIAKEAFGPPPFATNFTTIQNRKRVTCYASKSYDAVFRDGARNS